MNRCNSESKSVVLCLVGWAIPLSFCLWTFATLNYKDLYFESKLSLPRDEQMEHYLKQKFKKKARELDRVLSKNNVRNVRKHTEHQLDYYQHIASGSFARTVCEVGFNAGHSTLLWLNSHPNIHVYSFDEDDRCVKTGAAFVYKRFLKRFHLLLGEPLVTLPLFAKQYPHVKCDIIHIDIENDTATVEASIKHMQHLARPRYHVLLVNNTPCSAVWCVNSAWSRTTRAGIVRETERFSPTKDCGWSVGHFNLSGLS